VLLFIAHCVAISCLQGVQQPIRASRRIKDKEMEVLPDVAKAEYAAVMQVGVTPSCQLAALPHTCWLNVLRSFKLHKLCSSRCSVLQDYGAA
jgi:hypothetical protein